MPQDEETTEHTHLLEPRAARLRGTRSCRRVDDTQTEDAATSIISSHLSKDEQNLKDTYVGERLRKGSFSYPLTCHYSP
jgi:chloride channel 3/4/5